MKRKGTLLFTGILAAVFLAQGLFLDLPGALAAGRRRIKEAADNSPPYVSAILEEAKTGRILYQFEPHKPWPPASITKMMVMLLTMQKVKEGVISLDTPITTSAKASKIGGSQVYLKQGEVFPLREMMKAIVIHSANDATEAVAERIGGSAEGFVDMMNQEAKELGMKDTHYTNVHGLPPGPGQSPDVTSAYDIALLARQLVKYPQILKWASIQRTTFRHGTFVLQNTNELIGHFPGADGLKTGYYHAAGFNLAATAERDGLRLISVTLGSPSNKTRFREAARLLDMGFNNYKMLTVMKAGVPVDQTVRVKGGKVDALRPVLAAPARVLIERSEEKNVKANVELKTPVWATVKKGENLGELVVTLGNKTLGKFALVAPQNVAQGSVFKRLWDKFF